ncbi:MAG: hypothetical protein QME51_09685 [Planctomycetota bacterium]|nr:hypothetical protein [Planctomycetota bacterium]
MTEEIKKPDTRRWFEKITPCKNLNLERQVEFVDLSEINKAWGKKKPASIPLEGTDDEG